MLKIFSADQLHQIDNSTIQHEAISSLDLMENAAKAFVEWVSTHYQKNKRFFIFCGLGNNGGDGLAIARLLALQNYEVKVAIAWYSNNCSADFTINLEYLKEIKKVEISNIRQQQDIPSIHGEIIIDALLGSGLSRPVEGLLADIIYHINKSKAEVLAVDIPSGFFCDKNSDNDKETKIKATHTLTFQFPKLSFMFPESEIFVGQFHVLPIGLSETAIDETSSKNYYITETGVKKILKKRKKFSNKGDYGHALLLAGSYGQMGAAVLASGACLCSGAGLLTVHVPHCGYEIMQTSLPEAMTSADVSEHFISALPELFKFDAIGIGPGIKTGEETKNLLKLLIQNTSLPLVIDADAINILGENKTWLSFVPAGSIFTPHPKEFERLIGKTSTSFERQQKQIEFARMHNVYVVLKGAYTCIACPDGVCYFNSTGNPGMAKGGSGDVLTGMILSLLAQGYAAKEACILGVYIHGYAGDIAAAKKSEEAMLASDIIENIGQVFLKLRNGQNE